MTIKNQIQLKLQDAFSPLTLEIEDQSHLHANHWEGEHKEGTHLKIYMVSSVFENLSKVHCHQRVYEVLKEELQTRVHALSLILKAPSEL
jgi:BolA protein